MVTIALKEVLIIDKREELLRDCILSKFKSIKAFSEASSLPYMTIKNMLNRGIGNSSATNVIDLSRTLNIDFEALYEGIIIEKKVAQEEVTAQLCISTEPDLTIVKKFQLLTDRNKYKVEGQIDKYLEEQLAGDELAVSKIVG